VGDWRDLLGTKDLATLLAEAVQRLREAGSPITNLNPGGVFRTFLEIGAQGLADLHGLLEQVVAQGYVRTATGRWLDLKAAELGLQRQAARRTEGRIRFWREEAGTEVRIPAGTILATQTSPGGDRLRYQTIAEAVLPSEALSVLVPVAAETPGARYNLPVGQVSEILTPIPGIDGISQDPDWITLPGADEEPDERLRQRCLLRWAELGGATRDAYIAWAMAVPGVADVQVLDRFPRGPGTVDVVILGPSGLPGNDLVAAVQAHVDARRPICADVLVRGPRPVQRPVGVTAYLPAVGGQEAAVRAEIMARLGRMFASQGDDALRIGQWPYRSRIASAALSVSPVVNALVAEPAQDQVLAPDEWFVPTEITVSVARLP